MEAEMLIEFTRVDIFSYFYLFMIAVTFIILSIKCTDSYTSTDFVILMLVSLFWPILYLFVLWDSVE